MRVGGDGRGGDGGGGAGGGSQQHCTAAEGAEAAVQFLKEVLLDHTKAHIYTKLHNYGMDPSCAVKILISQGKILRG